MLHLLEMVLTGMGIILLCLLLLVVLLLILLLFLPFRYRLAGKKGPEEEPPDGEARVSWLLHAVSFWARWEDGLHYMLRIFGIPVLDNQKSKKKKKKKRREKAPERSQSEEWEPAAGDGGADDWPEPEEAGSEAEAERGCEPKLEGQRAARDGHEPEGKSVSIENFFRKIGGFLERAAKLPDAVREKAARMKETAERYRELYETDEWKRALLLCKKHLRKLWRDIRPKTVRANAHFGFADPALTGWILAAGSMLYPFFGNAIILRPEFEQEILEADFFIKGRLTLFVWLKTALIFYFNKDIRYLIRVWKEEEGKDDR